MIYASKELGFVYISFTNDVRLTKAERDIAMIYETKR